MIWIKIYQNSQFNKKKTHQGRSSETTDPPRLDKFANFPRLCWWFPNVWLIKYVKTEMHPTNLSTAYMFTLGLSIHVYTNSTPMAWNFLFKVYNLNSWRYPPHLWTKPSLSTVDRITPTWWRPSYLTKADPQNCHHASWIHAIGSPRGNHPDLYECRNINNHNFIYIYISLFICIYDYIYIYIYKTIK